MGRFESHLTFDKDHARVVEQIGTEEGWVYSVIAGCPILGKGTYCYLTSYDKDAHNMLGRLKSVGDRCTKAGATPLRSKIERIIYDTRTDVDEVTFS